MGHGAVMSHRAMRMCSQDSLHNPRSHHGGSQRNHRPWDGVTHSGSSLGLLRQFWLIEADLGCTAVFAEQGQLSRNPKGLQREPKLKGAPPWACWACDQSQAGPQGQRPLSYLHLQGCPFIPTLGSVCLLAPLPAFFSSLLCSASIHVNLKLLHCLLQSRKPCQLFQV